MAVLESGPTQAHLEAVLNSLGEGVLVVDVSGAVVLRNPALERLLGPVPQGLSSAERAARYGFTLADRVTPYPLEDLPLSRAIRGESCENLEIHARHSATGRHTVFSVTGAPLRDGDGRVTGGVVIIRDITAQKDAEAELQRSNAELEQFAYVASHDLQEPLRMVASYTQLLAKRYKGRLDADADEFIAYAVEGASRMRQLIQDLLTYSRVGSRIRPMVGLSSGAVLDAALGNLRTAIEDAGATITRDVLPEISGDEVQLVQVFQNLVGNAIKYRGAEAPRVHVGARRAGDEWIFEIRDNGIGIDPQYFERIFQLFQRLHGRDQYGGTGIGLTIARKIVERHGGRIWVESAAGRGSSFLFSLPAERTA